jgi:hypothetical protein
MAHISQTSSRNFLQNACPWWTGQGGSGARRAGADPVAVEILVDIRPNFKYQIHRSLSTLLRLFLPFLWGFLRCRVDPLTACRHPFRVVLQTGTLSLV